ncbi:MAG: ribonuclease Z [Bacteroidetes bacterium MedPE-SWsnd-G1]|nr:MAG: ribonuclease Z [Bacteroidetes bacterium MedPE-SWsnd-G1]
MKLTILGCHSATPKTTTHPTAQILEIKNHSFLIDCGEGTQVQMRKYKVKFSKIKRIFISHLHGDHVFGLIGLISTFRLLNRETELTVYGPKGIKELIVTQLRLSESFAGYPIKFHELSSKESELIFEDKKVAVYTIPLKHRIYTNGFLFKEKIGERKLDMKEISKYDEIEICDYQNLKNGKDFKLSSGTIIKNEKLTTDPNKPLSYAFCSDTMYHEPIIPIIQNVDLLYHEATFLKDKEDLALKTKHSTAQQAAMIAKKANVGKLILGHFSNRYKTYEGFESEACKIFSNTSLTSAGAVFELN